MKKIVFVCLGNICRSPMAEFVMKNILPVSTVASRATSRYEIGNPIYPGTQAIFNKYQIPYDREKKAQQITEDDFEYFDYIVGMDDSNVKNLMDMAPAAYRHKVHAFAATPVPDPWYTGDFEETYRLVIEGCDKWKKELLEVEGE